MTAIRRLFVDEIETIGFVGKGDNPPAEIVFFKRAPEGEPASPATPPADNTGDEDMDFDITKLTAEQKAAFDEAVAAEVEKRLADDSDGKDDLPQDLPEPVQKALDEMKSAVEKANERAEKAEQRTQEIEDQKERADYIKRVSELKLPGAAADDFAEILRKADSALTADERKKLAEVLKGASAAISEALFTEAGRGGGGSDDVPAEAAALAKQYKEKDPALSDQMARAKVWQERPDLYEKYRAERARTLATMKTED